MNKVIALVTGVVLLATSLVFADQVPVGAQTDAQAVAVGNTVCPVSGNPIGVMGPGVEETYKGKIYRLCCGGCIGIFESDPERYSKIADDEVASESK